MGDGKPYYVTYRLVGLAQRHWADIDGFAVSQNMPPLSQLPLDRFTNFVWWWATRNAGEESDVEKFRSRLWMPPKSETRPIVKGPWSPEEESRAFAAFKSGFAK